jgi:hypothetical protein
MKSLSKLLAQLLIHYSKLKNKEAYFMSNSKLISYTKLSPNHSGKRTHSIDHITPHCVVGQQTVETILSGFASTSRQASCNYCIGKDGKVGLCVNEDNRSWCSSSNENDQRAVTIECASDTMHPYTMNNAVYNSLIELCVDICKRNGKTKLLWLGDKTKTLNYSPKSNEMVLTVHRWFAAKACPGDWLYNRLGDLAEKVTEQLGGTTTKTTDTTTDTTKTTSATSYKVKVTAKNGLNVRKGAGINYGIATTIKYGEVYTITAEKKVGSQTWGKLKSGAGWICLAYTKKV